MRGSTMGEIKVTADHVYRDFTTDGVQSSGKHEPTKRQLRDLFGTVDAAVYAAQAGITAVADLTARNAFFAEPANQGKLVYVNNNNGAADDPANGVYEYVGGQPRIAEGFYRGFDAVVRDSGPHLCTAVQGDSVNHFVITLPEEVSLSEGALYRFPAPATPTGPITIVVVGVNSFAYQYLNGAPVGSEAKITSGCHVTVRYQGDPSYVFRFHTTEAEVARVAQANATAPVVLNPEEVEVDGDTVNLLIPGQTGPVRGQTVVFQLGDISMPGGARISVNGSQPLTLLQGPNAEIAVGQIPGYTWMHITFRGNVGNNWALVATGAAMVTSNHAVDFAAKLPALRDAPWGSVGPDNVVTPIPCTITDCGSSLATDDPAKAGGAPTGYAPVDVLCAKAAAAWPMGGISFVADKQAIGGQTFNQFAAQLANSDTYTEGNSFAVLVIGGMNDFQIGNYNAGQSYSGARDALIALIESNVQKGTKTLLCTSPHPNTAIYDYAYFYTANPDIPQYWPRPVDPPVSPTTGQFPPAADSKGLRDMTGGGTPSEYDLRFWHGNKMMRDVARLYPDDVILLDAEWAWFRFGVEVHGVAALFAPGQDAHPNTLGHQVSFGRVFDPFVRDFAAGNLLRRYYRGDE